MPRGFSSPLFRIPPLQRNPGGSAALGLLALRGQRSQDIIMTSPSGHQRRGVQVRACWLASQHAAGRHYVILCRIPLAQYPGEAFSQNISHEQMFAQTNGPFGSPELMHIHDPAGIIDVHVSYQDYVPRTRHIGSNRRRMSMERSGARERETQDVSSLQFDPARC